VKTYQHDPDRVQVSHHVTKYQNRRSFCSTVIVWMHTHPRHNRRTAVGLPGLQTELDDENLLKNSNT